MGRRTKEKSAYIELMLELILLNFPGRSFSFEELAYLCDCHESVLKKSWYSGRDKIIRARKKMCSS